MISTTHNAGPTASPGGVAVAEVICQSVSADDELLSRKRPSPTVHRHVPSLDGIRGLAIALVLACHFAGGAVPAGLVDKAVLHAAWSGWIGVDLFFVLSGFLITSILVETRTRPHYFRNFYIRRTLRIFPLYYSILVATLLLPAMISPDLVANRELQTVTSRAPWFWTYTTNIDIAIEKTWAAAGILGHFWSLAVEEQFYLVWPALVWWFGPVRLRRICLGIIVATIAVRWALRSSGMALGAFTLMPARADAFAAGAWLAVSIHSGVDLQRLRRVAWWTLLVTGVALAMMFVRVRPLNELAADVQLVGYSFLAFGCAAVIVLAIADDGRDTVVSRIFRHASMRFLGKYSYAIYCLHPLVQVTLKSLDPAVTVHTFPTIVGSVLPAVLVYSAIVFAVTVAVALASWHVLEKHFLRLKIHFA